MAVTHWWLVVVAAIPALLATILVFLDQQITAVIVNRSEHKLKVQPTLQIRGCFTFLSLSKYACVLSVDICTMTVQMLSREWSAQNNGTFRIAASEPQK